MEILLRSIYRALSPELQRRTVALYDRLSSIPVTTRGKRNWWIRNVYTQFGQDQRWQIFMSIARFAHINRPIEGYYMEFGCHEANTMRKAYDCFHYLFDWIYVAFDSFEGLPEIAKIDKQEIWHKGKLKTEEKEFIRICLRHGIPGDRLITVKGFYEESLNDELKERFLPRKAAVIYIDCDLYKSTVPVLRFIADFLQKGTVIVFDDWNCFHGDPEKGEKRAFREFLERNPNSRFEQFVKTAEVQSFVCVATD